MEHSAMKNLLIIYVENIDASTTLHFAQHDKEKLIMTKAEIDRIANLSALGLYTCIIHAYLIAHKINI